MNQDILKAVNLSKSFDGKNYLFKNINLELKPGDLYFLKGKSGSGKTFFLKTLTLLNEPQSGEIFWGGKKVEENFIPKYRSLVHFLGQNTLSFEGSVLEFLKYPLVFECNKNKIWGLEKIVYFLNELGFSEEILEKRVHFLSGGEKQLIKLLRSLLFEPKGLLLDEPTSSMDEDMRLKVEKLILERQKEKSMFILWISHNVDHFSSFKKNTLNFPNLELEYS